MADWLVARFVAAFTGADIRTHEIAAAANNGAFKRLLNRFPLHATLLPAKLAGTYLSLVRVEQKLTIC
jgi:hypothetical protein